MDSDPQSRATARIAFSVTSSIPNVAIFKTLANELSERGYAVLRYNKHYVNGPRDFDRQSFFTKASTQIFVQDLDRVIAALKKEPRIDAKRIFLYGWSEGTAAGWAPSPPYQEEKTAGA